MNNMKRRFLLASVCVFMGTMAYAQNDTVTNRVVIVENEYNPTIMDASKLNVLPQIEEPSVPKSVIDYATVVRPTDKWEYQEMPAVVRDWAKRKPHGGYIYGAYGNRENVDAGAGLIWDINPKNRFEVSASLKGWNGNVGGVDGLDWKSRFYQSDFELEYRHRFGKVDLLVGGNLGSQVFNYMPDVMERVVSDKQHHSVGNVHAGFASTDKDMSLRFQAEVGFNVFDRKYDPFFSEFTTYELTLMGKGKEKNPYAKGEVSLPFKESNRLAVAFDLNHYSYSGFPSMENATSVELNPYYFMEGETWRLHLGAHIDPWKGFDSKLNFSPDVKVEYLFSDSYIIYARANGGRENRSLREIAALTPYWYLKGSEYLPTYVSLDAAAGFKASPADGLWLHLAGGYQIRENDLCVNLMSKSAYMFAGLDRAKTKAAYGSAEVKYDYKDIFSLSVGAAYYNWSADGEEENYLLALKPELELNLYAEGKVAGDLRVGAGYDYVKRCSKTYHDVSNLYAKASYALRDGLELFAKGRNLLGSEYCDANAYPVQGLNVLVGAAFRF